MRLVVTEHNNPVLAAKNASTIRDRLMPRLARRFYPSADVIVGVSAGVVEALQSRLGSMSADLLRVIYNPVVTDELLERAVLSPEHPWFAEDTPIIVAAGRLKPQKDFSTLVRAFAKVRTSRAVRLIILGEGPERMMLESLTEELGVTDDVALPGFVDNPLAYYSRAAVFVLSSRWEGLPTVLIEALACGAPVIATDCPSGPREILADGRYGLLLPPGDVEEMCAAIETALEGDLEPAPVEAWQPYRLETVVRDYASVLTGIE